MIRIAEEKDLEDLLDIYNDAILHTTATFDTECKTLENRREWLYEHKGRDIAVVYVMDGQVAGYGSLSQYNPRKAFDQTVEISIYVRDVCRGKGVGKALMNYLLAFAKHKKEIHTVISQVTGGNEASINLHLQSGFLPIGTIRDAGYKFDKYLDLNIYQLFV